MIDELHYYRGVYGSHLANVLRRLQRICEFYGSKPQFICCSATIANPRELAEALTGEPFELVERNGAPRGEKYFVFYNPPVVNRQLGIRRSYLNETRRMALEFIERGLQTLVFANNRLATEVLVTYLKDACDRGPHAQRDGARLPRRLPAARAPRDRARAARRRDPRAWWRPTPGAGHRHRLAGRGGDGRLPGHHRLHLAARGPRRAAPGHFGRGAGGLQRAARPVHRRAPDYFFGRSPEHAYINPDNLEILLAHLKCAAFELPLRDGEKFGTHDIGELCRFLEETGFLHHSGGRLALDLATAIPADAISLRSVSSDNFVVVDITGEPKVIADVSFTAALTTLHEKAIYLHEARQYHVERFDYDERKAYVTPRGLRLLHRRHRLHAGQGARGVRERSRSAARARAHGEVRVNRQIVGFKKIKFYTMENVGAGKLTMPEQEMHTTAFWLHFPAAFLARFADFTPTEKQSGIAASATRCARWRRCC